MRILLLAAMFALFADAARAEDAKAKADPPADKATPKRTGPSLQVGDKAPGLKADKWLQGGEVAAFESGKVYVVEFWATWCGPCIVMMPHLADLADEYKAKGLTVIGYTVKDPNNSLDRVEKFMEKRGPKLTYTFAYSDGRSSYEAWMTAAERRGIPCTFVVDGKGKIAYIGHPMYLDMVVPKVVAGTWDIVKDKEQLDAAETDVTAAFSAARAPDAEDGLKQLADLSAKWPMLGDIPYFTGPKLTLLLKAKKFDEAKAFAEKTLAKATKRDDSSAIGAVAVTMRSPALKENKDFHALAVTAAEALYKIAGADNVPATTGLAEAYAVAGEAAKAKELGMKAVALAEKALKGDKDFNGLLMLATTHSAVGDKVAAKAAAERAIAATEGQPENLQRAVAQRAKFYGAEPKKNEEKKDK